MSPQKKWNQTSPVMKKSNTMEQSNKRKNFCVCSSLFTSCSSFSFLLSLFPFSIPSLLFTLSISRTTLFPIVTTMTTIKTPTSSKKELTASAVLFFVPNLIGELTSHNFLTVQLHNIIDWHDWQSVSSLSYALYHYLLLSFSLSYVQGMRELRSCCSRLLQLTLIGNWVCCYTWRHLLVICSMVWQRDISINVSLVKGHYNSIDRNAAWQIVQHWCLSLNVAVTHQGVYGNVSHCLYNWIIGSEFGGILDMVTDRVSTAGLLMILAQLYPDHHFIFNALMSIDIFSHWFHVMRYGKMFLLLLIDYCDKSFVIDEEHTLCFPYNTMQYYTYTTQHNTTQSNTKKDRKAYEIFVLLVSSCMVFFCS